MCVRICVCVCACVAGGRRQKKGAAKGGAAVMARGTSFRDEPSVPVSLPRSIDQSIHQCMLRAAQSLTYLGVHARLALAHALLERLGHILGLRSCKRTRGWVKKGGR